MAYREIEPRIAKPQPVGNKIEYNYRYNYYHQRIVMPCGCQVADKQRVNGSLTTTAGTTITRKLQHRTTRKERRRFAGRIITIIYYHHCSYNDGNTYNIYDTLARHYISRVIRERNGWLIIPKMMEAIMSHAVRSLHF